MKKTSLLLGRIACVTTALASSAHAAEVTINAVDAVDAPDYNLSSGYGTADWAYWTSTSNPAAGTPSNRKSGGNLISDMSLVGDSGSLRGSANLAAAPVYDLGFSDGTAPTSGTVENPIGLFHSVLNTNGKGLQVTVTAPTADPFEVYLWATAYNAVATLTATVGSASATDSSMNYLSNYRTPGVFYTVSVTPDSVGQAVNLQLVMTGNNPGGTTNSDNVSLSAVAVGSGAVVEPQVTSTTKSGSTVTVEFTGAEGQTYLLNKSTTLEFSPANIVNTAVVSGGTGTLQDTNATENAAFYRVESQ